MNISIMIFIAPTILTTIVIIICTSIIGSRIPFIISIRRTGVAPYLSMSSQVAEEERLEEVGCSCTILVCWQMVGIRCDPVCRTRGEGKIVTA